MFNFNRCVALQYSILQGMGLQVTISHNIEVQINMKSVYLYIWLPNSHFYYMCGSPMYIFTRCWAPSAHFS